MIKAYIKVYEHNKKKDGTPFRRLSIQVYDKNTGELFELYNKGMTAAELLIYDTLIEMDRIQIQHDHDVSFNGEIKLEGLQGKK